MLWTQSLSCYFDLIYFSVLVITLTSNTFICLLPLGPGTVGLSLISQISSSYESSHDCMTHQEIKIELCSNNIVEIKCKLGKRSVALSPRSNPDSINVKPEQLDQELKGHSISPHLVSVSVTLLDSRPAGICPLLFLVLK